jgi:predicted aconitase with swiveling domain
MHEQEMTAWGKQVSDRVDALPQDRRMMLAKYVDILSRCMAGEDGCKAVLIIETENTVALGAVNADTAEAMGMVAFAQEQMYEAIMADAPPREMMN